MNFKTILLFLLLVGLKPTWGIAIERGDFQVGYKAVGIHVPTLLVPSTVLGYATENWTIQYEYGEKAHGSLFVPEGDTFESLDTIMANQGITARFFNLIFISINRRSLYLDSVVNITDPTSPLNANQTESSLTSHAWIGTIGIGPSFTLGAMEFQLDTLFYSTLYDSSITGEVTTDTGDDSAAAERERLLAVADLERLGDEFNQIFATHGAMVLTVIIRF